jgi:hypothetical protein
MPYNQQTEPEDDAINNAPTRLLLAVLTALLITPAVALAAPRITYKTRVEPIALITNRAQVPIPSSYPSYMVRFSVPSHASFAYNASLTINNDPNEYLGLSIQTDATAKAYLHATAMPSKYAPLNIKNLGHGVWRSIVGFNGHEYYYYAKKLAARRILEASFTINGATPTEQNVMSTTAVHLVRSAEKA